MRTEQGSLDFGKMIRNIRKEKLVASNAHSGENPQIKFRLICLTVVLGPWRISWQVADGKVA